MTSYLRQFTVLTTDRSWPVSAGHNLETCLSNPMQIADRVKCERMVKQPQTFSKKSSHEKKTA
ncbi:hypothetical protein [Pseudomonas sp. RA_15y_Pfl2_54]|uniref:hypothetical protein n=1 Tax=Pseudomonas sp. RA_15y_Pfl2_54 TaxID=3088704 RepID=UPI0030D9F7B2